MQSTKSLRATLVTTFRFFGSNGNLVTVKILIGSQKFELADVRLA
jgi:hypothetical protein